MAANQGPFMANLVKGNSLVSHGDQTAHGCLVSCSVWKMSNISGVSGFKIVLVGGELN
jgi:hypothetical protein